MSRYVVQTVTGYSTGRSRGRLGLSAHVCDTVYLHEVVASYRSERRRVTHAMVIHEATTHAARLNDGS